ncbi:MAG TPA: HEAT repeat domain-containing protein [Haliangiales bacterium]|nr:HEAT repeat domain-containing protein [Haliangiales bacterium]
MSGSSRLSSLLVRDGLIGVKRMEQAFQRQVIYGGALDTILLEMGSITEERLVEYLSLASGLPPADKDLLSVFDPRAVQVCPRELAEEHHIVPVAFDGDALRVLVTDPVDLANLEALATRINAPVQPFVIPEFRFNQLVERIFGVPAGSRFQSLAARLAAAQRPQQPEPSVIVEDVEIRRVAETKTPSSRTITGRMSTDTVAAAMERAEQKRRAASQPLPRPEKAEAAKVEQPAAPTESVPQPITPKIKKEEGGVVRAPWRGGHTIDPKPLEPRATMELLVRADDRDAVFSTLVRGIRSRTRYAAILVVQGDMIYGRAGIDVDAPDAAISQVAFPLAAVPVFEQAILTKSPYIGPVAVGRSDVDALLARMGGVVPPSALVLPLAIRDRVVGLAYAHRGADTVSIAEVAEVLPLANEAATALTRLIVKAKSAGFRKPQQPAPAVTAVEDLTPKTPAKKSAGGWARASGEHPAPAIADTAPGPGAPRARPAAVEIGRGAAPTPPPVLAARRPIDQVLDAIEAGGEASVEALDEAKGRVGEVLPQLARRFPGKLWVDRYSATARPTRASQHGPLLALTVQLGERAASLLVEMMGDEDREHRYYATLACGEVRGPLLMPALVARLFDHDYGVRAAAINALLAYPAREIDPALEVVRGALHGDPERARAASGALGELRDVRAIPDLIAATDGDHATAEEARRALIQLTKQDFGTKARKWRAWWEKNAGRHRIEWMIDGLVHSENDVRLSASEELKRMTGEYFGYHHDLPKREREEARQRWARWWEETGKRRFQREGREEHDRPTAMLPIHPPQRREP